MLTVDLLFAICCGLNLGVIVIGLIMILKVGRGLSITVNMQQPNSELAPETDLSPAVIAQAQQKLDKAIEDERQTQKQTADLIAQLNMFMTGGDPDAK